MRLKLPSATIYFNCRDMSTKRSDAFLAARSYWEKKLKVVSEPRSEAHVNDIEEKKQATSLENELEQIPKGQLNRDKSGSDKDDTTPIIVKDIGSDLTDGTSSQPIVISDDEVLDGSEPVVENTSPIRLLFNPSYDDELLAKVNKDTVKISTLLGTKSLNKTFQFNFNVDLEFVLSLFHPDVSKNKVPITFVVGGSILSDIGNEITGLFNLSEVIADIPNRFGTHHTKMMINFYDDNEYVQVVIMTCNYTKLDLGGLTQMLWKSEKMHLGETSTESGKRFQVDLINYLKRYNKQKLTRLAQELLAYDFLSVKVELLASTPGTYDLSKMTNDSEIYGYGKLYQILKRNDLLVSDYSKTHNLLSQVTSITYPFAVKNRDTSSVFTHLLCPLIFSGNDEFKVLEPGTSSSRKHQSIHNYHPHIIFPTAKEVASSNVGFGAGQAIHFNYSSSHTHTNQYNQNIKPYLRKWSNFPQSKIVTGRESVMPHVKLMICDNGDNWSSFKWVVMGSHNLSKQAWGSAKGSKFLTNSPNMYDVASYELSVVVIPEPGKRLVPLYATDSTQDSELIPIRMPFMLPPKHYGKDDQPWSMHLSYGDSVVDKFGQTYNLE